MKKNRICTIYKITNNKTNQIYIGSSVSIESRIKRHFSDLKLNKHHSIKLQKSFNKYGKSSFEVNYLVCCPEYYRQKLEQWFLDNNECYYNINKTVDKLPSPKNRIWTDNSLNKLSNSKLGNKSKLGLKCSEETKILMSKNSANKRAVLQFNMDGIFIKEWESASIVSKELKFQSSSISICCNGKRRQANGYIWRFKDEFDLTCDRIEISPQVSKYNTEVIRSYYAECKSYKKTMNYFKITSSSMLHYILKKQK